MIERPTDLSPHESWAWTEAEFCDRMSQDYRGHLLDGWKKGGDCPNNSYMQAECLIRAECWEQMARNLRQPYYVRKEREAYEQE